MTTDKIIWVNEKPELHKTGIISVGYEIENETGKYFLDKKFFDMPSARAFIKEAKAQIEG